MKLNRIKITLLSDDELLRFCEFGCEDGNLSDMKFLVKELTNRLKALSNNKERSNTDGA